MAQDDLEALRTRIDEADREILVLLQRRLGLSAEVGRLKARSAPFLRDPARETELLARLEGQARELGLDPFRTKEIFREVIAMSLKVQEEMLLDRQTKERSEANAHRVSYQGVPGAYSHQAARKYFSGRTKEIELVGFPSFSLALLEAETGSAGYAFLPIENTTAGSINETYDLLQKTPLRIVGEEVLEVRHCLLGLSPREPSSLRRILSHPQALAQCSRFLASLTGVESVAFGDTADAARRVREDGDPSQAAIASEEAGRLHDLVVLSDDINDQKENWTRFVVVSSIEMVPDPRIPAKTSLVLVTPHRQGALAHCLNILAEHGLNLTKLESRPVPRQPFEYLHYVDFEGSLRDEAAAGAVARLTRDCPYVKVLGSYPSRTTERGRVDRQLMSGRNPSGLTGPGNALRAD